MSIRGALALVVIAAATGVALHGRPGMPAPARWEASARAASPGAGAYRVEGLGQKPLSPPASGHRFPVAGKHRFGEAGAAFGAARGGGGHQGQDVFAACGTPLVAARAGKVQFRGTHGRAGNYLVVDGSGTTVDHMYAHLRDPALVRVGDRVLAGQRIGYVGRTGAASACHLHFEMWPGGWYEGGAPVDPLPRLRSWARA
jgi:murein DD-endopeptidase MepM/ murein hydrolase activator NlpD